jgi:outer membrane protein insertion porin family
VPATPGCAWRDFKSEPGIGLRDWHSGRLGRLSTDGAITRLPAVVLLAISFLFLFLQPAIAQQAVVEDIRIHGNRRIPVESIRARIFTRPGDVYDEAALERDFNSLWNTSYFDDLRFEREQGTKGGWILHVYVNEKPTIREINYLGLNSVSQSDVLDRFKERKVGLTVESQYDPTKVKKAEVTIKELLAEHGRQFATVRTEVRPIPPAAVGVNFVVKEGPKVKVGRIRFEGNKNLKSRELRRAMKNLRPIGIPKSIVLESIFSKTFDASKLNEDAEMVRDAYQQKGYFKALVQEPKTQMRDTHGFHIPLLQKGSGKAVDITIPIEEGDRYHLGSVTFKNYKAVNNVQALRGLFPMKDGEIFNTANVRKGLENMRKAYGELGYINFTPLPDTQIDEDKKLINLVIDIDEGKQFFVRRIEFQGNTTTRDKVIRRELAIEEGQIYNTRLWELSLLRLNQLDYFEPLKPEEATERKLNEPQGTVDLTLKVKEKGKNSIQLTGGVSGLAGSFIGLSYTTNNFLGLGETLQVQASIGDRSRNLLFGFTEPYMFDRPLQVGFTVFNSRLNFDQAKQQELITGQRLNLPQSFLANLQNFTQNQTGFTLSASYPLHRSFKRVGITYSWDTSTINTFSDASTALFENLAFRGIAGPNALRGVVTSKVLPSFTINTVNSGIRPTGGHSFFVAAEFAGLGGTVQSIRPIVQYKRFMQHRNRNVIGFNVLGSFLTGYGGLVAPPFNRFYMGGDNDLRGFDIRSISPIAFLPDHVNVTLTNPDGSAVPKNASNPRFGAVTVPVPVERIVFPGGDTSIVTNLEYRIPIAGPVVLAPFADVGFDGILRPSQLRINSGQLADINGVLFGCPQLDAAFNCTGGTRMTFDPNLKPLAGTNFIPRMSTGLELQVMMPVINAPFRVYWAYNPLRLDTFASTPNPITRSMFPPGGAGDYTYQQAVSGANFLGFSPAYLLREPRKTFRFTVSTTF